MFGEINLPDDLDFAFDEAQLNDLRDIFLSDEFEYTFPDWIKQQTTSMDRSTRYLFNHAVSRIILNSNLLLAGKSLRIKDILDKVLDDISFNEDKFLAETDQF